MCEREKEERQTNRQTETHLESWLALHFSLAQAGLELSASLGASFEAFLAISLCPVFVMHPWTCRNLQGSSASLKRPVASPPARVPMS